MTIFGQAEENFYVDRGLTPLPLDEIRKLKLGADIVLGDFVFNTIDEHGVVWVVTDIDGWWNPPDADMPDVPRGYGDGSYDVQGRYVARDLSLEGVFLTHDPALVEAARDRLVAAADLVYRGAWLKTGTNPVRASWVRLSGGVQVDTVRARGRTQFSIGLRAPDPVKYLWNGSHPDGYEVVEIPAKNVQVPAYGQGTLVNAGNYPVSCVLEVVGPLAGPATILNSTTQKLIIVTQGLKGALARSVASKQMSFNASTLDDTATLTTQVPHEFFVGDSIVVSNVGATFNGPQTVESVPTETTLTYRTNASTIHDILYKGLTSNVATLEMVDDHNFSVGDRVVVVGVDSAFDGSYVVLDTPAPNSITYARTRVPSRAVTGCVLVSNIATLTTVDPHEFIAGDTVTISGVGINYDGTFTIIDTPSTTQFRYAATRTSVRDVTGYDLTDNGSTSGVRVNLLTSAAHGFVSGENVNISGINSSLDGGYRITSTPVSTQFTYTRNRVTSRVITTKAMSPSNVATITTQSPHNFVVGERVTVRNVDSTFNGTYTITAVPTATTFSYSRVSSFLVPTSVPSGTVDARTRVIKNRQLVGNEVILVTNNPHGALIGEQITVTGLGAQFNGTYVVTRIPSLTSLVYTKVSADVALADAPANSFVEMLGTDPVTNFVTVSPSGRATVAGTIAFAGVSGLATIGTNVTRTLSPGKAVKTNEVTFTSSGLSSARLVRNADVLEIDTKDKEVAYNGVVNGARGRIDVLADFIELQPGDNEILFEDAGAPESEATLRIYYRSGWLS